jgi:hypothetical protein
MTGQVQPCWMAASLPGDGGVLIPVPFSVRGNIGCRKVNWTNKRPSGLFRSCHFPRPINDFSNRSFTVDDQRLDYILVPIRAVLLKVIERCNDPRTRR